MPAPATFPSNKPTFYAVVLTSVIWGPAFHSSPLPGGVRSGVSLPKTKVSRTEGTFRRGSMACLLGYETQTASPPSRDNARSRGRRA